MRRKYLLLALVALALALGGCKCDKKHFAPPPEPEVEMLDYHMNEFFNEGSQEWTTRITGNIKNNTSQTLTIWVRGKFFNYDDAMVGTEGVHLRGVEPGNRHGFYIYYSGERIKRVEAWVEDYY